VHLEVLHGAWGGNCACTREPAPAQAQGPDYNGLLEPAGGLHHRHAGGDVIWDSQRESSASRLLSARGAQRLVQRNAEDGGQVCEMT
jgi:hypothetical protein